MSNIKIVTDSAIHLSPADIHNYHIHVMNPPILVDGKLYGYVNKISSEKFLQLYNQSTKKPVIGQVSVDKLVKTYDELGADGSQILSIHLSDKLTDTYANAVKAAKKTNSLVTVLNSQVTAAGLAYQVTTAAKDIQTGKPLHEIQSDLENIRNNTRIYFSVQCNLQLVNHQIVGKLRGLLERQMNVQYILQFTNNEFSFVTRGRKEELVNKFWDQQLRTMHHERIVKLAILHSGGSQRATFLYKMLSDEFPFVPISMIATNPEMASFIGPESTGVTYLLG
ncbi:MAG: DegV family protein [Lentilactobacillus diolivorans]|uniref:DegV family protein n=1 Tax=Lentilactobacillus diolivorans TaxID=179838 RepID=UPI0039EC5C89